MNSSATMNDYSSSDDEFVSTFLFDDFDSIVEHAIARRVRNPVKKTRGGSKKGKKANKNRNIAEGARRIFADYFAPDPTYDETDFRRRFRMSKRLCLQIIEAVTANEVYFTHRPNAAGKFGATPFQKITGVLKVLAYGTCSDAFDDYVRLSDTTLDQSLRFFVKAVTNIFGKKYLRPPNAEDMQYLMAANAERGMPGMLGSLDCTHWHWENCPTAWKGQYQDRKGNVTNILEAIASQDGWIWHAFFGMPGSCNDINVLDNSSFLFSLMEGGYGGSPYQVNGQEHSQPYFLVDGIYPSWSCFALSSSITWSSTTRGAWKPLKNACTS
jgi:hypothetical protein